jgi:hypothetical protein
MADEIDFTATLSLAQKAKAELVGAEEKLFRDPTNELRKQTVARCALAVKETQRAVELAKQIAARKASE